MKLPDQVRCAIEDTEAGKFEAALLHACTGIDATSRRLFPNEKLVGVRYKDCLRHYYWLLEPMVGSGINLEETRFTNIKLKGVTSPDFADVVYEVFRCHHAHGDEVPPEFEVVPTVGGWGSRWVLAEGRLHMPDRVVWALLALAVLSRVNAGERSDGEYYMSLGDERFIIAQWWGREADFRPIAERYNTVRVKLEGL